MCERASKVLRRIAPAAAAAIRTRVSWTMSIIWRMPRPRSPTGHAVAPRNPTSPDAMEWVPNLSFSRWITKELREPSSRSTRHKEQA